MNKKSHLFRIFTEFPLQRIIRGIAYKATRIYRGLLPVRILANSIPKSGTNLLKGTLFYLLDTEEFFHVDESMPFEKVKFILINKSKIGIITAHLFPKPNLLELLKKFDFKLFLIIRDPRDVVVSYFHYIFYNKQSIQNPSPEYYLYKSLSDDNKRLIRAITNFWSNRDIGSVYKIYKPWLNNESVCSIRYENLIGPEGGGTREAQIKEIKKIASHLGLKINSKKIENVARKIFYRKSAKFRKGQIGDWRNHFNEEHKKIFKEVAGKILIELGYEKDLNW